MFQRKGYIGRQMSINAKSARDRGFIPMSEVTADFLNRNGFNYSIKFFKWLCKKHYTKPKEVHHTGVSFRNTGYFDEATVRVIAEKFDLDLLYQIYLNKIDRNQAKNIRKIKYVKIRTTDKILGLRGKNIVELNCVRCGGVIWYSQGKYIKTSSKEYVLLKEWELKPTCDFYNPNINKVVNILLKYKPKYAFNILRRK